MVGIARHGLGPDPAETACCGIAVMAKASSPGRTKTRLCPPLTGRQAADFNTAFLADIADNVLAAASQVYIKPYMAFAPAGTEQFFREIVPARFRLIETTAANFGDCLYSAIDTMLARDCTAACVLNSDSPTLPTAYIVSAVVALGADGDRGVIGPSLDGGYYLLGLKRAHRRLFEDIVWSSEHVFERTLERAGEIGLPMTVLPSWYDVDDALSLRILAHELLEGRPYREVGPRPSEAAHSRRVLAETLGLHDLTSAVGCVMSGT